MYHIIDLDFQEIKEVIAAFLIETSEGPVLIETGPHSTILHLEKKIYEIGYKLSDIKNVLLTHIHFDHAGAAWALAALGAKIHLHPVGLPHLANPEKLVSSAKRIYQDQMDKLWGLIKPISKKQLFGVNHNEQIIIGNESFIAHHTPGHAAHHIAWQWNKAIFTGDVGGVKIGNGPVIAPCPPPDINIELWHDSIEHIIKINPEKLYLTHFGEINLPKAHLIALKSMLLDWSAWIKTKWEQELSLNQIIPLFMQYTASQFKEKGVDEMGIKKYETANPSWMSVSGLIRYWKKKI